ncbi:MAG: VTT domain-containing protein, partial [Longimicrobiales bacterium]
GCQLQKASTPVAVGFPRLPLCAVAAVTFGFALGLLLSQIASVLGAYCMFLFVRWGGAERARAWLARRPRMSLLGERPGLAAVFLIRQAPITGVVINLLLALSRVRHRDYVIGTFLGFLPRKGSERKDLLERLATSRETTVLFESPERLTALLEALAAASPPHRKCAVGRELTKIHEEFVRGSLAEVAAHFASTPPRGEITVVLAAVADEVASPGADLAAASALAAALLEEGVSASRAAKEVARRLRIPRNQAYEVVQSVTRERDQGEAPPQ